MSFGCVEVDVPTGSQEDLRFWKIISCCSSGDPSLENLPVVPWTLSTSAQIEKTQSFTEFR